MIAIKPYAEIIDVGEMEALKKIELVGRTCYKSEGKITEDSAPGFVSGLIKRGHEAMLEHASFCFEIGMSGRALVRGIMQGLMSEGFTSYVRVTVVRQELQVYTPERCYEERTADHLLANGVIVPPCKVGDTVYKITPNYLFIKDYEVVGFHLGEFPTVNRHKRKPYLVSYDKTSRFLNHITLDEIGKTVFLTREEAEAALAERSKG